MNKKEAKKFYGKDPAEWLDRWDKGETVWSIEMGGLGPGYEQAIQITVAEILRDMLFTKYDHTKWNDEKACKEVWEEIDKVGHIPPVSSLGVSGAQWEAAVNVASRLYRFGPIILNDDAIKDRHIQVSKNFPSYHPLYILQTMLHLLL